eukprot:gene11787-2147_t
MASAFPTGIRNLICFWGVGFKNPPTVLAAVPASTQAQFVAAGGILFYSHVKSLAPALVYVAAGYEPDGHAAETQNKKSLFPGVYSTVAEYRQMCSTFKRVFAAEGVANSVLDPSCAVIEGQSVGWVVVADFCVAGRPGLAVFVNLFSSLLSNNRDSMDNCSP